MFEQDMPVTEEVEEVRMFVHVYVPIGPILSSVRHCMGSGSRYWGCGVNPGTVQTQRHNVCVFCTPAKYG